MRSKARSRPDGRRCGTRPELPRAKSLMWIRGPAAEPEDARSVGRSPVAIREVVMAGAAVEPGLDGLSGGEDTGLHCSYALEPAAACDTDAQVGHLESGHRQIRVDTIGRSQFGPASRKHFRVDLAKPSRFSERIGKVGVGVGVARCFGLRVLGHALRSIASLLPGRSPEGEARCHRVAGSYPARAIICPVALHSRAGPAVRVRRCGAPA